MVSGDNPYTTLEVDIIDDYIQGLKMNLPDEKANSN
jgi:hypothetical protein